MHTLVEKAGRSSSVAAAPRRANGLILAGLVIGLNAALFLLVQRANADLLRGDFKMFYTAALALRSGHASELYSRDLYVTLQRQLLPALSLYDVKVYTHPPYELLVFWPLSFLGYKAAGYCWLAVSILLGLLCGRLLPGYAAVLGLFPFLAMLLEQQDSVLALLLLIACWRALREAREVRAGILLGLALFKFQIVVPLALLLLFWRPAIWKGLAISSAVVVLLSYALAGPAGMRSYARYVSSMAQDSAAAVSARYRMDPRTNPTLRGLTYEILSRGGESAPPLAAHVMPFALGLLDLLCIGAAAKFMRGNAGPEAKFSVAVLAALLVSFHLLMHDLLWLALPFVLLRGSRARQPLLIFYLAPLVYLFYPSSQAWLALVIVLSFWLVIVPGSRRMVYEPNR